jgi:hypothetical protein
VQRTATIFAIAAAFLLVFGLMLQLFVSGHQFMSITLRKTGYMIDYQVPCYATAALCALFACLYALHLPRVGNAAAQWHLWLTVGSLSLFILGFGYFAILGTHNVKSPSQATLIFPAVGMIFGPILFAAGQLLFFIAAIRSAFR